MPLTSIHSGAQTGADRAGLDAALALGLEPGGWIPYGKRTDDGPLSIDLFRRYKLREHPSASYKPRTWNNVLDCDVTFWFGNVNSPGFICTNNAATHYNKPLFINPSAAYLREIVEQTAARIANVAGNRERTNPGIYQSTLFTLIAAFGS
jgi:hypothetical protein